MTVMSAIVIVHFECTCTCEFEAEIKTAIKDGVVCPECGGEEWTITKMEKIE